MDRGTAEITRRSLQTLKSYPILEVVKILKEMIRVPILSGTSFHPSAPNS